MKLYILTDLEGVGGVVLAEEQTTPGHPDYEKACIFLTEEVNSAVEGAFRAGATEILINDAHYKGYNIKLELLDERVSCLTGRVRPMWLPDLDETYDGVILIGMHAMAGTDSAVLDHTMSSKDWQNMWINGKKMGEMGIAAIWAGHFDVPVIFVSGDDKACLELKNLVGNVETVVTKKGISRECAICYPIKKVREMIRDGVEKAVENIKCFKPFKVKSPIEIVIEYKSTTIVDSIRPAPGRKILDGRKVLYKAKDIISCSHLIW
jgi:D-amino peptidase